MNIEELKNTADREHARRAETSKSIRSTESKEKVFTNYCPYCKEYVSMNHADPCHNA